jgi:chemotaxis signal transduction protein
MAAQKESEQNRVRFVRFLRMGECRFAVLEDQIASIADWRKPVPLPHAPPAVRGVVLIQGRVLTVLDPAPLLGSTDSSAQSSPTHIVVLKGDEQISLAVEEAEDPIDVRVG